MHEIKMYIMFTLINVNEISTFFEEIAAAKTVVVKISMMSL
jgi:hypothetical protein